MSVRDLSSALMAMDVAFQEADAIINNGRTETRLVVKGSFKTGSFKIEFSSAQALVERFKDLLAGDGASAILNAEGLLGIVLALIGLIKWLGRRNPTRYEYNEGRVRVYVHDKYMEVEKRALDLYRSQKVKQALQKAVHDPLQREGVESFAIIHHNQVAVEVRREDAPAFAAPEMQETVLEERRFETHLNIVSPSFHADDKWRVNDGGANFYVYIADPAFTERLLRDEVALTASTTLRVRMLEVQYKDSRGQLRKESEIEEVLGVLRQTEHHQLDFSPLPSTNT